MDIVTLAAARKGGGSGGDVTKQYVDEHLALKADKSETAEFPIASTTSGVNPSITDSADGYVQNLTLCGESRTSKNLMQNNMQDTELNGVTWHRNEDGTISISGTPTSNSYITYGYLRAEVSNQMGTVVLSGMDSATNVVWEYMAFWDSNESTLDTITLNTNENKVLDISEYPEISTITVSMKRNVTGVPCSGIIKPQLELGSEPTPYEPYFSGIHGIGEDGELEITTANSDSSESSTATLTTGLPYCGIPVETGETYTDEQGQKWLADTADVEGVVKRCYKVTFDGSADEGWLMPFSSLFTISAPLALYKASEITTICDLYTPAPNTIIWSGMPDKSERITKDSSGNIEILITDTSYTTLNDFKTYLASNPITVIYELAIPTTQELTTAEKSALRNLRTYAPTTNVTVTDNPTVDIGYLLGTANGQAVANAIDNAITGVLNTSY